MKSCAAISRLVYPWPASRFRTAAIHPADAFLDDHVREFLLPYDAVRTAADPDAAVLQFRLSTYQAGADLGGWDRSILEPAEHPEVPPRRPWSPGR